MEDIVPTDGFRFLVQQLLQFAPPFRIELLTVNHGNGLRWPSGMAGHFRRGSPLMPMTLGQLRAATRLMLCRKMDIAEPAAWLDRLNQAVQSAVGDSGLPRESPVYLLSQDGETPRAIVLVSYGPSKVQFKRNRERWSPKLRLRGSSDPKARTEITLGELEIWLHKGCDEAGVGILCDGFGAAHWSDLEEIMLSTEVVNLRLCLTETSVLLCPQQKEFSEDAGTERKRG